jgi:hypothetical protein
VRQTDNKLLPEVTANEGAVHQDFCSAIIYGANPHTKTKSELINGAFKLLAFTGVVLGFLVKHNFITI